MKLFLFLVSFIAITNNAFTQACPPNIDFEFGNFTNWRTFTGFTSASGGANILTLSPSGVVNNVHTIYGPASAGIVDQYGGFPVLCPNGSNYSVKLGNSGTQKQAERILYNIAVPATATNFSITYNYAVVFQDPNHAAPEQPRFVVKIYDQLTGDPVNCASFDFVATANLPGFETAGSGVNVVRYKPWSQVTVDLSGNAGRNIVLEFTTADCTQGGHFGYAYLDVDASCSNAVAGFGFCIGSTSMTVNGPSGYETYNWLNSSMVPIGTGQSFIINNPVNNAQYFLDLVPYNGYGCRDTLPITLLEENPPSFPNVAVDSFNYCQNATPTTFVATTTGPALRLYWYTSLTGAGSVVPITPSTGTLGVTSYYVAQRSEAGCEGPKKEIKVNIQGKPNTSFNFGGIDSVQCINGNNFSFFGTSTGVDVGTTYLWDFGDGATSVGLNATHSYNTATNYIVTLKATKSAGCFNTISRPVTVFAKPIANFTNTNPCATDSTTFINNTTLGYPAIHNYFWNFGSGNTSILENPSTVVTTAVATIPVYLKVTAGSCSHDTTLNVAFFSEPFANFTINGACINSNITFTSTSTINSGTINNWTWFRNNTLVGTSPILNEIFTAPGIYAMKLQVGSFNCTHDTIININIANKPTAAIKNWGNICENTINTFYDSSYTVGQPTSIYNQYYWNFGNGTTANTANASAIFSSLASPVTIKHVVTDNKGCVSDTGLFSITINPKPIADFAASAPLCHNGLINFTSLNNTNITNYNWTFYDGSTDNMANTTKNNYTEGAKTTTLETTNNLGCVSVPFVKILNIKPKHRISFSYLDSCLTAPVPFRAVDSLNTNVDKWFWNFGTGYNNDVINPNYTFSSKGIKTVLLYAVDTVGCVSDTLKKTFFVNHNPVTTTPLIVAAPNQPKQLLATNGVSFVWTPATGLNNANIANPIATMFAPQNYTVTATDLFGCKTQANTLLNVFKFGPTVYVPLAFSPNGDGLNETLKPLYVGITKIKYFSVYNRFGALIFNTTDMLRAWDGTIKGKLQPVGTYIWVLSVEDYLGKRQEFKGTTTIVK